MFEIPNFCKQEVGRVLFQYRRGRWWVEEQSRELGCSYLSWRPVLMTVIGRPNDGQTLNLGEAEKTLHTCNYINWISKCVIGRVKYLKLIFWFFFMYWVLEKWKILVLTNPYTGNCVPRENKQVNTTESFHGHAS